LQNCCNTNSSVCHPVANVDRVHRSAVSNTIGANASLTFSACLDDLVSVSWRYKIRSKPARFAGCLWHRWLLERLQKALRLSRSNDFVRTIPRCQAAEPICRDQSMLKSSGVGATLSVNALHIRHVVAYRRTSQRHHRVRRLDSHARKLRKGAPCVHKSTRAAVCLSGKGGSFDLRSQLLVSAL